MSKAYKILVGGALLFGVATYFAYTSLFVCVITAVLFCKALTDDEGFVESVTLSKSWPYRFKVIADTAIVPSGLFMFSGFVGMQLGPAVNELHSWMVTFLFGGLSFATCAIYLLRWFVSADAKE